MAPDIFGQFIIDPVQAVAVCLSIDKKSLNCRGEKLVIRWIVSAPRVRETNGA
jgi:hypothetical protein